MSGIWESRLVSQPFLSTVRLVAYPTTVTTDDSCKEKAGTEGQRPAESSLRSPARSRSRSKISGELYRQRVRCIELAMERVAAFAGNADAEMRAGGSTYRHACEL